MTTAKIIRNRKRLEMTQMPGCWHIGQMNPGTDGRWGIRAVRKTAGLCTQHRMVSKLWRECGVGYGTICIKEEREERREMRRRESSCI